MKKFVFKFKFMCTCEVHMIEQL